MNKKISCLALCAMLFALCVSAHAQQAAKVPRIGLIIFGSPSAYATRIDAFRQGLRDLGYREGQNIVVEYRYTEGKASRLAEFAEELTRIQVDVIVTTGTQATATAKKATTTIPIVMASAGDPVATGLVASLSRPGGNITGLGSISPKLSGKRLEILREIVPRLSRVAVLSHSSDPTSVLQVKEAQEAARSLRLELQLLAVNVGEDLQQAFANAGAANVGAISVLASAFITGHRKEILELAAKHRMPAAYDDRDFADSGGLISYGPYRADMYRRAATYVDKILKGAKTADLPVEQPTKFELVVNLKTAKQIGLTIPPNVLARADKVIR